MIVDLLTALTITHNSYNSFKALQHNLTTALQQCLKLYVLLMLNYITRPTQYSTSLQLSRIQSLKQLLTQIPMYNTVRTLLTIAILLPSPAVRTMLFELLTPRAILLEWYVRYYAAAGRRTVANASVAALQYLLNQPSTLMLPYVDDQQLQAYTEQCTALQSQCKAEQVHRLVLSVPAVAAAVAVISPTAVKHTKLINNSMTLPTPVKGTTILSTLQSSAHTAAVQASNTVTQLEQSVSKMWVSSNGVTNSVSNSQLYDAEDDLSVNKENDSADNFDEVLNHVSRRNDNGVKHTKTSAVS